MELEKDDTELEVRTLYYENNILDVSVTDNNKLLVINLSSSKSKLYVYKECKDYEIKIPFPLSFMV